MARFGDRNEADRRRNRIRDRVAQLGRRRRAADAAVDTSGEEDERRVDLLERRIDYLERLLEGLQDAVHRESVRQNERIEELERKSDPREISRALSRDAREHGL
jgi:hypothetical protein